MDSNVPPLPRRRFLQKTSLTAVGLALTQTIPPLLSPASAASPLSAVPARRLNHLATGANVCRWFRFPKDQSDAHFSGYISDAEAAMMARIGLKHVRLCVAPEIIMDPVTGALREDRARFVEAALRRFHRVGLLVIVDIHNENRAAELDPQWQDAFVRFWGTLAGRLASFDPDLTLLETVNEPVFEKREPEWNQLNARLIATMRTHAPEHTLMTSGPNWGGIDGLRKLTLLEDRNIVYSFHCYDPFPFTHQGATWSGEGVKPLRQVPYPSTPEAVAPLLPDLAAHPVSKTLVEKYGRDQWNKDKLAARFKQGIDWGVEHRVPLYCGEFGVYPPYSKPEHRAHWFRDFGAVLAENKIGWAVWGWDEGFGLNRKTINGQPTIDPIVAEALGLKAA